MSVSSNLLAANVSGIETDATGWTAGANTTRSQSTRFYTGSKSLQLVATAAGSVTATTTSRVAVTAGDTLTAYGYFANVVAAAGRTCSVSVSWWAGVTGGTALSTSTSASVTLPNSTSFMTPPPILVATVPAGALYASVAVTVTGLTTSAAVVVDAIALGPPAGIVGNLVPYTTASVEVDASGWQSLLNSTVSRSSTTSWEGWYALSVTSAAAGLMRAGMVGSVPVTPGVEYFAYAWASSPVAGSSLTMSLRWLDGTGTQIGVSSAPWTIGSANVWDRRGVIGTAPVGAVSARLVMDPTASGTGEVWLFDQAAILPAPTIAGSLIGYSPQSMETTASGWTAVSGCTVARSLTQPYEGLASLAVTASGGDAVFQLAQSVPVTARQSYKIAPKIYSPISTSVDFIFTWLAASGAVLSTNTVRWNLSSGAGFYSPPGSGVATAGAARVSIAARFNSAPASTVFYLDNIFVGSGGLGVIADPVAGAYGARISVQGLTTSGYTFWGLWRMTPDGATTPIRGSSADTAQMTIISDVASLEDYEAPLGVPVLYMVKLWTDPTSGFYQTATSTQVTLPEPPDTDVVIKDPLLPARWTQATVETLPDWSRAARQGVNQVRGRARPIVISDVRSSRVGSITLVTETDEEKEQLWWVLDTGNALLIQWPSSWHEPDMYVSVGDAGEAHLSPIAQYADREFTAPLTEIDRPVGGVVGSASRTWQDVLSGNADWLSVLNGAKSWLDVLTGVRGS